MGHFSICILDCLFLPVSFLVYGEGGRERETYIVLGVERHEEGLLRPGNENNYFEGYGHSKADTGGGGGGGGGGGCPGLQGVRTPPFQPIMNKLTQPYLIDHFWLS